VTPVFAGRRLLLAREQRGLTQAQLANEVVRLGGTLTPAAISQYENSEARPKSSTLSLLATALGHPLDFFAAGPNDPPLTSDAAFFRSLRSTSARDRRSASSLALYAFLFAKALERYVGLPVLDLPNFPLTVGQDHLANNAARSARDYLDQGQGPVDNVVQLLERHGVVVIRVEGLVTNRVDAFSIPAPERPVVVLGGDKKDWSRSRFDAAHELGHLVLHSEEAVGERWAESQAHAFSAEFLMPAQTIRDELPSELEWDSYLELKQRWGVSVQALVRRAKDLHVIDQETYLRAAKLMSAWGWRKPNGEPGPRLPLEEPRLLSSAIEAAREANLLDDLREETGIPQDVIARIAGNPPRRVAV
jgi:Zn-dependent peptidase ImmA (M78 family)/transcriptional regulator with XRE-family HTH domain